MALSLDAVSAGLRAHYSALAQRDSGSTHHPHYRVGGREILLRLL